MNVQKRHLLIHKSLQGLSIGDAFGESFFGEPELIKASLHQKTIPETSWEFTDDTVMAIAVVEQLEKHGMIHQDELAHQWVEKHNLDENRGYGATARRILREIGEGGDWRIIANEAFEGMGSLGNGAAMRVAPIGAYFFDDIQQVKSQAVLSAEITHTHEEAKCGAIAVALATALATQAKVNQYKIEPLDFIKQVYQELPDTDTAAKIKKSMTLLPSTHIDTLRAVLGNGTKISAPDTIPFCIWSAAYHLDDFEAALWHAVSVLGDRDTICAIVGGIVSMSCEEKTIPPMWLKNVEDYQTSTFRHMEPTI